MDKRFTCSTPEAQQTAAMTTRIVQVHLFHVSDHASRRSATVIVSSDGHDQPCVWQLATTAALQP